MSSIIQRLLSKINQGYSACEKKREGGVYLVSCYVCFFAWFLLSYYQYFHYGIPYFLSVAEIGTSFSDVEKIYKRNIFSISGQIRINPIDEHSNFYDYYAFAPSPQPVDRIGTKIKTIFPNAARTVFYSDGISTGLVLILDVNNIILGRYYYAT